MTFNPSLHHRRSIRAKRYDYTTAGAYFITICVEGRRSLLGEINDAQIAHTPAGCLVENIWNELPSHYPGIELDAFIVMPNHIHGIIVLTGNSTVGAAPRGCPIINDDGIGQPQGAAPTIPSSSPLSLPDIIHRFKSFTTAQYRRNVTDGSWPRFAGTFWQRNYYEHIIRNDAACEIIRDYISGNPWHWNTDKENPHYTGSDLFDVWLNNQ